MDDYRVPVVKNEYDDDDDEVEDDVPPAVMARAAVKAAGVGPNRKKNRLPSEARPEFGVTVVEESQAGITKDITVIHTDWKTGKKGQGVELFVPGPKRNAVAWQVAHTYFAYDGAEMFVCNICGKDLKLSGTAGAISSHLKRRHPGVKEQMEEVERNGGPINSPINSPSPTLQQPLQKKRKSSSLPMAANKKASQVKMIPFPRDIPIGPPPQPESKIPSQVISKTKPGTKAFERKLFAIQAQKEAQVMYLIGEGLNFSHAESSWHRHLIETTVTAARMGAISSNLELSSNEVRSRIFVASRKLREHLKERLKGKELCAAANHWTSRQNMTYASFSAQWIEDFKLESAVLAVYLLKGKQVPIKEDILRDIDTKLQEWELGSNVKFVVADRTGNTNAFGWAIDKLGGSSERITCLDYMLNLVATKAFEGALGVGGGEDFGEFDTEGGEETDTECEEEDEMYIAKKSAGSKKGLLPKVRKLVSHFDASIQASDELMVIARQLCGSEEEREALKSLTQDVNSSWWSTQNMLERLFALREAITTYVGRKWMPGATTKDNRPPRLAEEEWEALEELYFMLRPLRFAQQMLQCQRSMTSSFVPLVIHLIYQELETIHLEQSNNVSVKTIAKDMLGTMDELFGNFAARDSSHPMLPLGVATPSVDEKHPEVKIHKAILIAHALDPRFKPLSVFPTYIQDRIWADLLEQMVLLGPITGPEQAQDDQASTAAQGGGGATKRAAGITELDNLFQLYATKAYDGVRKATKGEFDEDTWKRKCEIELKQYRETSGMEPKMDSNVLEEWWGAESRSSMYPTLWRLAQRVLSINATSAPAHRAFSTSSSLAIYNRCKMGSGDEILHFLHENARRLEDEGIWDEQ